MKPFLRLLLLAHPADARERLGNEIIQTVLERVRREPGWFASVALFLHECAGIVSSGIALRLAARRESRPPKRERSRARASDLVLHDVRIAIRSFSRQPAFTLVAVGALALGIGAAVAIFSVFHAVLLRPLPFHEPSRLVSIWEKNPERNWNRAQVAAANYVDWRASAKSFVDMAGYNDWVDEKVAVLDGEPTVVITNEVTGTLFDVLGVRPAEGRAFDDEHTWAGPEPAVVLSYRFWNRRFSADPGAIGTTLELDGTPHRILGVMPEGFEYPFRAAEVWVPLAWDPESVNRTSFRRAHGMRIVGRLAPGVTLEEAASELETIAARLELEYPETNTQMGNGVTPLHEWIVGDASRPLSILMAAVLFLLLIACANVSNMLLARTSGRADELRLRSALGGGRRRLVLQGLLESVLLAVVGGGLGLALGFLAIRPLLLLSPDGLPRLGEISVDTTVIAFAIGLSVVTGILFGSVPAWRGARLSSTSGARGASSTRSSRRASHWLVGFEVALTLPLVVGAGLMVRTLSHLSNVEPGFVAEGVVVANIMAPSSRYDTNERIGQLYRTVNESLATIPGVEASSMSSRLPFVNQRWSSDFTAEGWSADRYGIGVRHDEIMPGLFRAMSVPLLRGRDFDARDRIDSIPVVIINEALADRYFPGEDPIGKRITFDRIPDADSTWRTIVGVVGNVRREALSLEEEPSFYAPVVQDTTRQLRVLLKTERDAASVVAIAQERVHAIDPMLPLFDVTTLTEVLKASLARERFLLVLLTIAAVVALALASIGIFGVVWHGTTRRAREIGIRMALGARASAVIALVLRGGLRPVVLGAAAGVVVAGFMARTMSAFLFEVEPLDVPTFVLVVAIVLAAATLACVIPARWATRIDQTTALRSE